MYAKGYGVPKDKKEAIKWFQKAAGKGDEEAKKAIKKLNSWFGSL